MTKYNKGYRNHGPKNNIKYFRLIPQQHSNLERAIHHNKETKETTSQPLPIIDRQNWYQRLQPYERIAFWGVIVNSVLAFVTIFLFIVAFHESHNSDTAAKDADSSVNIAKQTFISDTTYNGKNFRSQLKALSNARESEIEKEARDNATFNLQQKGLDAQINSFKETRKNFERSNRAYLEVNEFLPLFNSKKEIFGVRFNITNKGSQPAKIISAYYSGLVDAPGIKDTTKIKNKKNEKGERFSEYVSIYSPATKTVFLTPIIDTVRVKEMLIGVKNVYIYSECIYINLITNKKTTYKFIAEVTIQNSATNYRFIQNDNVDFK